MMKRIRIALLVYVVLLSGVSTLGAATRPKFQPVESSGVGMGRYVVTLAEDTLGDDLGALKRELALTYGARLESDASPDPQQFVVIMLPARARLLSADHRVSEVVEVPLASTAAASPETPAVGLLSAPSLRRFTPLPSGFGDNGQSGTYTYDGAGNITAIGADTYRYDTAQRLVSSVTRGVQEDYSYDAFGNRKSAAGAVNCLGQTTCAQTVTIDSNTNHLTTINGAAVTYDEAGNIKTIPATSGNPSATYSYDGTGMMTEAAVGSDVRQFLYTADDERIAVKQGTSWIWTVRDLSGKVLREFTSLESGPNLAMTHWQWAKDYVWRDGLLLATLTPSGTLHYHLDHLGTPRLVTDANGVKMAEHAYYPFGAENLTPHETPEEAMKFTGHERDTVAGDGHTLDYMHARYGNASLGRFLSVDPATESVDPGKPQSWNRYSYVRSNPLTFTDPTGRILWFSGGDDALELLKKSINADLGKAATFSIGTNGVATLNVNKGVTATKEQQAMITMLSGAISDPNVTRIGVVLNDPGQFMGKSGQGDQMSMDIGDMAAADGSCATTPGALAAHEIAEKWAMQSFGQSLKDAHAYATFVENRIAPWQRPIGGEQRTLPRYDSRHRYDEILAPYFNISPYYGGSAAPQWVTFKLINGKVVSVTP
jgi:RHS repeat-associated protein